MQCLIPETEKDVKVVTDRNRIVWWLSGLNCFTEYRDDITPHYDDSIDGIKDIIDRGMYAWLMTTEDGKGEYHNPIDSERYEILDSEDLEYIATRIANKMLREDIEEMRARGN